MKLDLNMLMAILGVLPTLIDCAEKLFGGGGTGEKKKSFVTVMASIFSAICGFSKGGQKEDMEEIAPVVGPAIDVVAGILFPNPSDPTKASKE
jgi:hypothetical protein